MGLRAIHFGEDEAKLQTHISNAFVDFSAKRRINLYQL
jgi:hypothetical protein